MGRPKGSKNKVIRSDAKPLATKGRKAFYLLWNPEGENPPTVTFNERATAEAEASIMQERIGKGSMFIMKAVGVVVGTLSLKKEAIA